MKRKPFYIITLKGIGYIILGNAMCLFMTMALAMFGSNWFTNILSILFSSFIFFSLAFTAAWKDGTAERSMLKLGRIEGIKKYRWIWAGLIIYAAAAAPTVVLLLNKLLFPEQDLLLAYRLVSGSALPFLLTFVEPVVTETEAWVQTTLRQIDNMPVIFPVLMLVYYALIPAATQLGYWCGVNDKLNTEKIMYK